MITIENTTATEALAILIGQVAQPGDNLVLTGDLGAGKTTLTKGIAKGLEIDQLIKSPTYTIIREYNGRIPLYHMDVYRVSGDADALGLDEYFEGDGLSVIEWGNQLAETLPQDYLELIIEKDDTDLDKRIVNFRAYGVQATAFLDRIQQRWATAHD